VLYVLVILLLLVGSAGQPEVVDYLVDIQEHHDDYSENPALLNKHCHRDYVEKGQYHHYSLGNYENPNNRKH